MTDLSDNLTSNSADKLVLPVDPEHGALRVAVMLSFVVALIVAYFIVNAIMPQEGINLLALIVGLGVATVTVQVIDAAFKRRWPSGRTLEVDSGGVRLALHGETQREIASGQPASALWWRFEIQRRARAPKGWYVVAMALNQGDDYLAVYTFMSPQDFELLPMKQLYVALAKDKPLADAASDFRAAGRERRIRTAENARWSEGAEIDTAGFSAYIDALRRRYPDWLVSE